MVSNSLRKFKTEKQQATLINEYLTGQTITELSKKYSCSGDTISSTLKRLNISILSKNLRNAKPVNDPQIIIDDYLSGMGIYPLAEKYDSTYGQIRKILVKEKILRQKNLSITVDDELVFRLYNQNLTFSDINKQTGYSTWCIGQSLKRQNIDTMLRRRNAIQPFQIYNRIVKRFTSYSWRNYQSTINPKKYIRGRKQYHIDHVYSIHDGFGHSIPPYIIGHWTNLQMLSYSDNCVKSTASNKTQEELFSDFFHNL